MPRPLSRRFFARESLEVAVDLIGREIHRGDVVLRITEVEAYRAGGDSASHCRMGCTKRNAPMWGPPGHAYVYLCYGMHQMLNVVTDAEGVGAAVLVRACEPLRGEASVRARRGKARGTALLVGPGRVGAALGIDTGFSGAPLTGQGELTLCPGTPASSLLVGPRVGVDYASEAHRSAPWRVADAASRWVSQPAGLSPLTGSVDAFLESQRMVAPHED